MSQARLAELFSSPEVKPVARMEIPSHFEYPPTIVLYGEHAFQRILRRPSDEGDVFTYMEVECWRAPDPERESALAPPAASAEKKSGAGA